MHDYLLGRPDHVAVLLSVNCARLHLQRNDASMANMVATGLFGDGAAAVVACGANRPGRPDETAGPTIVDTRSHLYPDTGRVMGWDVRSSGFQVVLDPQVPDVVRRYLTDDVEGFLGDHGLKPKDVTAWVCHPGSQGPGRRHRSPRPARRRARCDLASPGRRGQPVLVIGTPRTARHPGGKPAAAGHPGVLLAMGPGFACELVLLRW